MSADAAYAHRLSGTSSALPFAWLAGIAAALLLVGVVGYGLGARVRQEAPHSDSPAAVLA